MSPSSLLLALAILADTAAAHESKTRVYATKVKVFFAPGLVVTTTDADATVANVAAELDGEPVAFAESGAWVHGTATLAAEPADGAEVTLTAYDASSAVLATFTRTYTGGALSLASPDRGGSGDDCSARAGCESSTTEVALEVLAAAVYGDGTVGIDLAGADVLSVAYATVTSVETSSTRECVAWSRDGTCVEYATTTTRVDAELALDELGILWVSDPVELDGVATAEVRAYDERGNRLDKVKLDVATPWDDGGEGVNVQPLDADALTTVALSRPGKHIDKGTMTCLVVSQGWTAGDAMPEVAEVALENGETWTIPANSYQVTSRALLDDTVDLASLEGASIDGVAATAVTTDTAGRAVLTWEGAGSTLVIVTEDDDGSVWASVTAWSTSPDDLPTGGALTLRDGLGETDAELTYEDEVAVVFGIEAEVLTDPSGLPLTGRVELQGEANKRGNRATLVKGGFTGRFDVDGDGDAELADIDPTGGSTSRGDILIGGEPIDIEYQDGGGASTPPALLVVGGGGGGGTVVKVVKTLTALGSPDA